MGKIIIIFGIILIAIGLLIQFGEKIPWIGRLPGDILVKKENFSFYFPITTSILLSIIVSIILYIVKKAGG